MTTYGTIPSPTELPPPSSVSFIFRAREQIRSRLGTRRQWKEMIKTQSMSTPTNLNDSIQRILTNVAYFKTNYIIIILTLFFVNLLWHPGTLFLLIIMIVAWSSLYFVRDNPISIEGIVIDRRRIIMGLLIATIAVLFLTDVTGNIISGLSLGLGVVLVHGVFRSTADLSFGDEEAVNRRPVVMQRPNEAARLPLKNAAFPKSMSS
ncbi:hypothetical protein PTKIN_Ptkin19aG0076100 [Pterospermum kingtungense]